MAYNVKNLACFQKHINGYECTETSMPEHMHTKIHTCRVTLTQADRLMYALRSNKQKTNKPSHRLVQVYNMKNYSRTTTTTTKQDFGMCTCDLSLLQVTVERFLTPEQRKKLEEQQRLEEERRLREKGDNQRERALDMMMGGVLEIRKEDELKKVSGAGVAVHGGVEIAKTEGIRRIEAKIERELLLFCYIQCFYSARCVPFIMLHTLLL